MLYEDLELLSTQELLNLPPAKWLMRDLIPKEGFVGLYGAPGGGKSFIALDWAMCISEGRPWLGVYETQQAPVIYVAAEGGRGIQQRAREWMKFYGYQDLIAMYWLLNPLYVREEGTVEKFLETLEDRDIWPGLIVLDTLSRSFGGGEENASADMGHFVDQITKLAQGRRMASLIVHHTNATGNRERGSSAFRGAADAMFGCRATKDKDTNNIIAIELKNDKQKDATEAPAIWLRPKAGERSVVLELTDAPTTTKQDKPRPRINTSSMLVVLAANPNGLSWSEWRALCGLGKDVFNGRIKKLIANGEIYRTAQGIYFLYPANEDVPDDEV